VVQAERSTDDLDLLADTLLNEFFLHGAWFAIPLLCVLLLIIAYTIRGAIAPLNALSREATRIGPSSTDLRLAETNVPAEILPLVKAMNSVLDRLDAGFRLQREFTADAAHELRTPLAILRAQVEMIGNPDLTSSLTEDIDALSRVITQLLRDAQLGALDISSSDIADLAEIADETAELMRPLTIRDGKTIVVQRPSGPVLVYGNKEAIANAMRNLVENARRYTPHDRAVEIIIDPSGRADIRDHGPGIAPEDEAKIFTRFWRRNSADGGAGLGLSIVKKTMDLHGGAIAVAPTPAGGATFSLSFRLVSFL
jgi:signal transduction histidine kinase